MDRRRFLQDLSLLGLGALLIPKGRSMVGWTRARESGIYLHKTYEAGFVISQEMIEDDIMYRTDSTAFLLTAQEMADMDFWNVYPSGFTVKHLTQP